MIGRSWITFSLFSSYIITSCFRFILFNIIIYDSSYFLHNTYIVLCSIKVSFLFTLTSVFKFVNTNYFVYKILMVPDTFYLWQEIFLCQIHSRMLELLDELNVAKRLWWFEKSTQILSESRPSNSGQVVLSQRNIQTLLFVTTPVSNNSSNSEIISESILYLWRVSTEIPICAVKSDYDFFASTKEFSSSYILRIYRHLTTAFNYFFFQATINL